ncbi:MAG: fibronectin type III domain-containing protein [Caldilineaceae bacterium]|nr:fibronectin type III domain-containing protein [Caldilineaceae bacterium]
MRQVTSYDHILRLMVTVFSSCLLVGTLLLLINSAAQAGNASPDTAAPLAAAAGCAGVTAVPERACLALTDLYSNTGGVNWSHQGNWMNFSSGNAPCDWAGVTCNGNNVTGLMLARNGLSGTLPFSLGGLTGLAQLRLDGNALIGRMPPAICDLAGTLTGANFAYNGLFTKRASVEQCMQAIDPDWMDTQTTAVTDLRVTEFHTSSLTLAWTPIGYTADSGYYEISIATQVDGPYTVHGQTAGKDASTYLVDGLNPGSTYYLLVHSVTPPHPDQPSTVRSNAARIAAVTRAIGDRVLIAVYFPADNDLATEIEYVVERIRAGTALNPNVFVVMLVDGRQDGDTRVLEIAGGQVTKTNAVEQRWGVTELDSADPAVLAWFLRQARNRIAASRTVAVLMGHGIALAPEVSWPDQGTLSAAVAPAGGKIPPLPKEHEFSPSDLTSRGYMSTVDAGQALLDATNNGAQPFDVLYLDQCFQGSLDALYELQGTARVIVASPNYAWLVAAYDRYLPRITPTSTPEEIAQSIIAMYENALDKSNPNSIFWVHSSDLPAIAAAVSALGDALAAATHAGEQGKITAAVQQSAYVDTTQCGRANLSLGPPDELLGLETFSVNLKAIFGAGDPYGIDAALGSLHTAMERVQKLTLTGNPYIAPDEFWDYRDTITVLAPLQRTSPSGVAWRASIYRADAPFTATWTIDPSQPVTVMASLAFAREGRWDDFLEKWYTNLTPTVGQWCNYIPPEQVIVVEPDLLTLTPTLSSAGDVLLDWTPADDSSATAYWLYGKEPYDIGWKVKEILPIDRTSFEFTADVPGAYHFAVLARNADHEFVAKSAKVAIDLESPSERRVFLPLISR